MAEKNAQKNVTLHIHVNKFQQPPPALSPILYPMDSKENITRRIRDCSTYNFGMFNANKLAHEDAPAMLRRIEDLEIVVEFLLELSGRDKKGRN